MEEVFQTQVAISGMMRLQIAVMSPLLALLLQTVLVLYLAMIATNLKVLKVVVMSVLVVMSSVVLDIHQLTDAGLYLRQIIAEQQVISVNGLRMEDARMPLE